MKQILKSSTATLSLVFSTACSVFGGRTVEEPKFHLVKTIDNVEIREYEPITVAQTTVQNKDYDEAQSEAFRRLASYIFGDNRQQQEVAMTAPVTMKDADKEESGTSIAMTAPVGQQLSADGYTMTFAMPRKYTLNSLPPAPR